MILWPIAHLDLPKIYRVKAGKAGEIVFEMSWLGPLLVGYFLFTQV